MSARSDGISNRVDAVEQGRQSANASSSTWPKWCGCLSLPPSGLPIPTKRFPNEPFGGDPGDDGGGENEDGKKFVQDGSPTTEREIVEFRAL